MPGDVCSIHARKAARNAVSLNGLVTSTLRPMGARPTLSFMNSSAPSSPSLATASPNFSQKGPLSAYKDIQSPTHPKAFNPRAGAKRAAMLPACCMVRDFMSRALIQWTRDSG